MMTVATYVLSSSSLDSLVRHLRARTGTCLPMRRRYADAIRSLNDEFKELRGDSNRVSACQD